VPGFFRDTLNDATAKALDLKQLSIIHIDSDLYESARDALAFCTPFLIGEDAAYALTVSSAWPA
jgi:hypothetical protein